jgi:hypothetical protein
MIDSNGKFVLLTLDDARTLVLEAATAAGITVPAGSVEDQIKEWLAQALVDADTNEYASYVKQFNPVGSDIDLQNPGFPRLAASKANGFIRINNVGGTSNLTINIGTIFTAPNGITYTNPNDAISVLIGETKTLYIESVNAGVGSNLPGLQTFTGLSSGVTTNPQPLVGGRDIETDTQYLDRLIFLRTNRASDQTSVAVILDLLQYYSGAAIYINNDANGLLTPVTVPAAGYNLVVLFPSGVNAPASELQKAIDVVVSKLEFANVNAIDNPLHPALSGVVYTGPFPQSYNITVAQAVQTTINCVLNVSFPPNVSLPEKTSLSQTLAQNFIQRLINTLGGAAGTFETTFTPLVGSPVIANLNLVANLPNPIAIAPYLSIEDIRALIVDAGDILKNPNIFLRAVNTLTVELDPLEVGETPVTLSTNAPSGGTVSSVNFATESLFSDDTSWYDRYLFLDPSLITVSVNEVA